MKNSWKILSYLFLACLVVVSISCGDDDDPIIIDPGTGSINVANGLYLAAEGQDPSSTAVLTTETVEAEGFKSQDRSGFNGGYLYLSAGNYNVVEVTDKEISATIGGTAAAVTDDGSGCDLNDYTVITTSEGGASINVATSGLYRVTHDQMSNELVMYQITKAGIIGNATPDGWSADTDLPGSVTADGGSWSATEIILRSGEWKVRFNCRWSINRRTDPNVTLDDVANGYQLFTNFGGAAADLLPGNDGSNIQQTEDGEYTVSVNWDPRDGWSASLERTGDAPVLTFNPNDYQFGILGDATAAGWEDFHDRNMFHKFEDDVHTWHGVVTLGDTGSFKFRTNSLWDFNIGGTIDDLVVNSPDNLVPPAAGDYYITISTADEGETWTGTMDEKGLSVIGAGQPGMGWGDMDDTYFNADGFANGVTTYSLTGDFSTDIWKFRGGGKWGFNFGGDLSFLTYDGDNIELAEAGTYLVTVEFDGEILTGSAVKQ